MLKLCGFAISNYYNKVKLVLLEKGIPFEEQVVRPGRDEAVINQSPAGKIPFLVTDSGTISESTAIVEYLEEAFPEPRLLPVDPYARAKCRELIQHLELNVELVARRTYSEAFFGQSVSEEIKGQVRDSLGVGLLAVSRLARLAPYALGEEFSLADCALWPSLGIISCATEAAFGENLLARVPGVDDYLTRLGARPHFKKVAADRAAAWKLVNASQGH